MLPVAAQILICCEGKTEKLYFDALRFRVFRIPGYIEISIEGEKEQHKALIDRTVERRAELASEQGLPEEEIECWAVCDDDGMSISYTSLCEYAEENSVNLAFSRPQFEAYLLQHFEQSKETDQQALYDALKLYKNEYGYDGEYDKSDLSWLEQTLIDKPKLVDIAIVNADQRTTQSAPLFLTVQELTKRLMELARF